MESGSTTRSGCDFCTRIDRSGPLLQGIFDLKAYLKIMIREVERAVEKTEKVNFFSLEPIFDANAHAERSRRTWKYIQRKKLDSQSSVHSN